MTFAAVASPSLKFLEDRWDPAVADKLDEPELLRYRSNLLGSDLRITNFAGGNTSSKIDEIDPLTGQMVKVLWVKGSGGDLGSIKRTGFATLYQEKLLALEHLYRGQETEDSMVEMYAVCAFRNNPVAEGADRVHLHHRVFCFLSSIEMFERQQFLLVKRGKPRALDAAQVAAASLHPQHLHHLPGERINFVDL